MTRANPSEFHSFDPGIERTYHKLARQFSLLDIFVNRWSRNIAFNCSSSPTSFYLDSEIDIKVERNLRELGAPDVATQTLYIQYPDLDVECELKSSLIHFCPSFMVLQVKTHNNIKKSST